MAFPTTLDDLSTTRASQGTDKLSGPDHLVHHIAEDTAIQAIEAKVGINTSAVVTSLDYLLKNAASINPGHLHNALSALDGVPSQAIYVNAAGNVGIGTTGPYTKFEVLGTNGDYNGIGDARFGNSSLAHIRFGHFDSNYTWIQGYGGVPLYINPLGNNTILNATAGNVGIGTTIPTAKIDINSDILRLRTAKTPATAGAAGNQGDLCWDADFIYICVATNTWKKVAIVTW